MVKSVCLWPLRSSPLGSARLDSTRLGSARLSLTRLGLTRLDSTQLDRSQLGSTRLSSAQLDPSQSGSTRLGSARLDSVWLGSRCWRCSFVFDWQSTFVSCFLSAVPLPVMKRRRKRNCLCVVWFLKLRSFFCVSENMLRGRLSADWSSDRKWCTSWSLWSLPNLTCASGVFLLSPVSTLIFRAGAVMGVADGRGGAARWCGSWRAARWQLLGGAVLRVSMRWRKRSPYLKTDLPLADRWLCLLVQMFFCPL